MRFDSSIFFRNEFFTKPSGSDNGYCTIDGVDYDCIYTTELDPQRHAPLIQEGGSWALVDIYAEEWEAVNGVNSLPHLDETLALNGTNYTIRQRTREGDTIKIQAIGNQRKKS